MKYVIPIFFFSTSKIYAFELLCAKYNSFILSKYHIYKEDSWYSYVLETLRLFLAVLSRG